MAFTRDEMFAVKFDSWNNVCKNQHYHMQLFL